MIGAAVYFHSILHGFREGRGTGTASIKSKLIHQLIATKIEVLYEVFLYLKKSYDSFDRDKCIEILLGYGIVCGQRGSSSITRIASPWWPDRGTSTEPCSRETEGSLRGILYPPPSLPWWLTQ